MGVGVEIGFVFVIVFVFAFALDSDGLRLTRAATKLDDSFGLGFTACTCDCVWACTCS